VDFPAVRLCGADELGEPGTDLRFVEHPVDDLLERSRDRDELADDHVPQREPTFVERVLDLPVDGRIAELERDPVEEVGLGDRAVEIEDDRMGCRARHARMFPEPGSSAERDRGAC
jgi:hypothetical protein